MFADPESCAEECTAQPKCMAFQWKTVAKGSRCAMKNVKSYDGDMQNDTLWKQEYEVYNKIIDDHCCRCITSTATPRNATASVTAAAGVAYKCPHTANLLKKFEAPEADCKGRYHKGAGYLDAAASSNETAHGCADKCVSNMKCRGFAFHAQAAKPCIIYTAAGLVGRCTWPAEKWAMYVLRANCTSSALSTLAPTTASAPTTAPTATHSHCPCPCITLANYEAPLAGQYAGDTLSRPGSVQTLGQCASMCSKLPLCLSFQWNPSLEAQWKQSCSLKKVRLVLGKLNTGKQWQRNVRVYNMVKTKTGCCSCSSPEPLSTAIVPATTSTSQATTKARTETVDVSRECRSNNTLDTFEAPLPDTRGRYLGGAGIITTHANTGTRERCGAICLSNTACHGFAYRTHTGQCSTYTAKAVGSGAQVSPSTRGYMLYVLRPQCRLASTVRPTPCPCSCSSLTKYEQALTGHFASNTRSCKLLSSVQDCADACWMLRDVCQTFSWRAHKRECCMKTARASQGSLATNEKWHLRYRVYNKVQIACCRCS